MKIMTIFTLVIVFVILFTNTSISSNGKNDIDLLWKARAFQAAEKISESEFDESSPKSLSKQLKYELSLEFAFAIHLTEPEIVIKKNSSVTSYHLVLNFGDDGGLDVLYNYSNKTQELVSVQIARLPKNLTVTIPVRSKKYPEPSDYIYVSDMYKPNENPSFLFGLTDPFKSFVLDNTK